MGVDLWIDRANPSLPLHGLLDEAAHLTTTYVLLNCWERLRGRQLPRSFRNGALAASVLIDVDHVPQAVFGSDMLTAEIPRPYPHSLSTVVVLTAGGAITSRSGVRLGCLGAATGVLLHLLRDLATGEVALLWPFSTESQRWPYLLYAVVLAAAAWPKRAQSGRRSTSHAQG